MAERPFALTPQPTPEERLIAKLRDWVGESGWVRLELVVIYEGGVLKYVERLSGKETVKL